MIEYIRVNHTVQDLDFERIKTKAGYAGFKPVVQGCSTEDIIKTLLI